MVSTQISRVQDEIFYESCKTTDPCTGYTTPGFPLSGTDRKSLRRSFRKKYSQQLEIVSVTGEISALTV